MEKASFLKLIIIYLVLQVAAILSIFIFLDRIEEKEVEREISILLIILSTCHLFRNYKMCLLIPIVIFFGLQQGFVFGDFTRVRTIF